MKRSAYRFAIPFIAVLAIACGDDSTSRGTQLPTVPVSSQVASVEVSPQTVLLNVGDSLKLVATPRDAGGAALLGRVVAWTSEFPSVATVSSTGVVRALTVGSVRVTATSEGRTGAATLTLQK